MERHRKSVKGDDVASLGELERQVMDITWADLDRAFTVRDVAEHFPDHAYTTIMTVMSRLAAKGFLDEEKVGRVNTFRAHAPREDYITSLLMDALSSATDRQAVLAKFADELPTSDASLFRKFLSRRSR